MYSRAISTYLCNQYEKGDDSTRLYPIDPKARGIVDQILYVSENTSETITKYLVRILVADVFKIVLTMFNVNTVLNIRLLCFLP